MRVLVTGAGGFVGMSIMDALKIRGHQPIGVVRPPYGDAESESLSEQHDVRFVNLRDVKAIQALVKELQPEYIVHAAAITPTLDLERTDPLQIFETNELSTLALLHAAASHKLKRFVLISSAAVYETRHDSDEMLTETSELNQSGGMYALTKIGSEQLCHWTSRSLGLDTRIVRLGPVYGIHERPTSSRTRMSLVHQAVTLARTGVPIRCNNSEAVYDWIFSVDAGAGIATILDSASIQSSVFNLAGPNVTMEELLNTVSTLVPSARIEWVDTGEANLVIPNSYRRSALDTSRILTETSFRPVHSLQDGLDSYLSYVYNT